VSKYDDLIKFLFNNKDQIIEKHVEFAQSHNFVKYTATMEEAWRASIAGINDTVREAVDSRRPIPEH